MSAERHRIVVEVDLGRNANGVIWEIEEDTPRHAASGVGDFAATFGAGPGEQWDRPPMVRVVSVEALGPEEWA